MTAREMLKALTFSFLLDWMWVRHVDISMKWQFIARKYLLLFFPFLHKNAKEDAYQFHMWNMTILIPTVRHIGFFQSVFTEHVFLRRFLPSDPLVVDVGAHTGEFAIMCRTYLGATRVISVEPTKRPFRLLQHNHPHNNYNVAICSADSATMHIPPLSGMTSGFPVSSTDTLEQVPCARLDSIPEIQSLEKITLMKIDVEGMEEDVLRTSKETLQKTEFLLIEVSIHRTASVCAMELLATLRELMPHAELVHIGHIHNTNYSDKQTAVDLLFQNSSLLIV